MWQCRKKALPAQPAIYVQSTLEKGDFSEIHSESKSKAIMCASMSTASGGGWGDELHLGEVRNTSQDFLIGILKDV